MSISDAAKATADLRILDLLQRQAGTPRPTVSRAIIPLTRAGTVSQYATAVDGRWAQPGSPNLPTAGLYRPVLYR